MPSRSPETLLIKTDIRHVLLAVLTGAALSLLLLVVLGWHAFPSADDYCIAVESRVGFWRMQRFFYEEWTGRYAATMFQTVLSSWNLSSVYPWFSVGTVLATFLALRSVIASIAPGTRGVELAAAGAVATSVYLGRLPSSTEAFFWLSSATTYQWGLIVYLFWLSGLIRMARTPDARPRPMGPQVIVSALTILLPGFCEVLIPVVLLTLAGFVVAGQQRQHKTPRLLFGLLVLAVLLALASLAAPGNTLRSGTYPENPTRHNLEFALVETAWQTVRFLASYGFHPALWIAACAAWRWGLPTVAPLVARVGVPRSTLAGLVALLSGISITLFPLYWEYGNANYTGEGRTYNVTYFVLCSGLLLMIGGALGTMANRWPALGARRELGSTRLDWMLAGALVVLMLASPGTRQALQAARLAPDYLRFQQARESILMMPEHRGRAVVVNDVDVQPVGLFWGDIQPDEAHWINACVAKYYGLASVRTPTRLPPP